MRSAIATILVTSDGLPTLRDIESSCGSPSDGHQKTLDAVSYVHLQFRRSAWYLLHGESDPWPYQPHCVYETASGRSPPESRRSRGGLFAQHSVKNLLLGPSLCRLFK